MMVFNAVALARRVATGSGVGLFSFRSLRRPLCSTTAPFDYTKRHRGGGDSDRGPRRGRLGQEDTTDGRPAGSDFRRCRKLLLPREREGLRETERIYFFCFS